MKTMPIFFFILFLFFPSLSFSASNCGLSPQDWCSSAPGDPCGKHKAKKTCEDDLQCEALGYRGESVVACMKDGRGFARNCPTVGCRSRFELLQKSDCEFYATEYGISKWENGRCRAR